MNVICYEIPLAIRKHCAPFMASLPLPTSFFSGMSDEAGHQNTLRGRILCHCVSAATYMRKGMQLAYHRVSVVVHSESESQHIQCLLDLRLIPLFILCCLGACLGCIDNSSLWLYAALYCRHSPIFSWRHHLAMTGLFVSTQAKCMLSFIPPGAHHFCKA